MAQHRSALVADDDEYFRIALRGILEKHLGFTRVLEAGSLSEALQLLHEHQETSLAIFDLRMPGMASAASLQEVRARFPQLQVAVVSSSENRGDVLLALEARAHGYVPKGVGIAELSRALESIVSGQIYVPQLLASSNNIDAGAGPVAHTEISEWNLSSAQRDFLTLLLRSD